MELTLPNRVINKKSPTFFIAEIGQNHQGDINVAKQLIDVAAQCGADCVKFQKTCLREKFNSKALKRPYTSENSWGKTYGEHKKQLEFSDKEFVELQGYAEAKNIIFTASAMDLISLRFLHSIKVPFIKIGSGDSNNLILIEEAAALNIPLMISTGMLNFEQVQKIYTIVSKFHKNFALLHCISAYPTPPQDINLNVIKLYQEEFPDVVVGYSGHELGLDVSVAAVALGAKIIERHVTLDKTQKGSDHKCSLEPDELATLIERIRHIELALGDPVKIFQKSESLCKEKLGKTVVAAKALEKGHILSLNDLKVKVAEPKGVDAWNIEEIIGKRVKIHIQEDDSIIYDYLE